MARGACGTVVAGAFIPAAASALALASATAYSGIVIVPVVIAFAFLVWLPRMGARQASFYAVLLSVVTAAVLLPSDDCFAFMGRNHVHGLRPQWF